MAKKLYVLNGPNLNLLGQREPEIYGTKTLADIEADLRLESGGYDIVFRQSNHEGELVDWIQEARTEASVIIINAGAYTHTSVAIHDALRACEIPILEVHLSNPSARESFRKRNYIAPIAVGTIAGFGAMGYSLALKAAIDLASGETS
ncbi:MAG: type II 3-dehydroquinate dehydratase [Pseudomonadota bacterium]